MDAGGMQVPDPSASFCYRSRGASGTERWAGQQPRAVRDGLRKSPISPTIVPPGGIKRMNFPFELQNHRAQLRLTWSVFASIA